MTEASSSTSDRSWEPSADIMRILLVEDDSSISRFVAQGLVDEAHVVDVTGDGEEGLFLALNQDYDLIILDLMLPGCPGSRILEEVRRTGSRVPVIVLSARDAWQDKVELLDAGADDYVGKPFSFSELSARIRALLRRVRGDGQNIVAVNDLLIDPATRRVSRAGEDIELTAREFALLSFFAQNCGRVLTRRVIAEHVWDDSFESFSNIIDVYVNRLRNKIDRGHPVNLLHTIRGVGYVLKEDKEHRQE